MEKIQGGKWTIWALCGALLVCALMTVKLQKTQTALDDAEAECRQLEGQLVYQVKRRLDLQMDIFWFSARCLDRGSAQTECCQAYLSGVTEYAVWEPMKGNFGAVFRDDTQWEELFDRLYMIDQALCGQLEEMPEETQREIGALCRAIEGERGGLRALGEHLSADPHDQERMEAFAQADRQLLELERVLGIDEGGNRR